MKYRLILFLSLLSFSWLSSYPQYSTEDDRLRKTVRTYGQAEVLVPIAGYQMFDILSRNVSVTAVRDKTAEIRLSPSTVEWFIKQKFNYSLQERTAPRGLISAATVARAYQWDSYPTYTQYDSLMRNFTVLYPSLCQLDTIGTSIRGKLVLALRISGNTGVMPVNPEVFYTSTMHGDETGGFILMLRLADYLLSNYNNNDLVKELVDNLVIWINPLSNPDGTYNSGDSIGSPVRFNADGVDLNRNFPDPDLPGMVMEKETIDMISFMSRHRFVLSANFHSGSEVVNYPWDRWLTKLHADNDWFYGISRGYADTAHVYSAPGYMSFLDNGVTRGAVWYIIYGGRQDFVTQYLHGREVTIELDNQYITPVSQLSVLWEANRRSLLGYLENALYGIHGIVLDSASSAPVAAEVFIKGHDTDSSQVYSDTISGFFVRFLTPGTWPLTFTAGGYRDTTVTLTVNAQQKTDIILYMQKGSVPRDSILPESPALYPNPASWVINALLPAGVVGDVNIMIINLAGKIMMFYDAETFADVPFIIDTGRLSPGVYTAVFTNAKKRTSCRGRFIVIK